MPARMLIVALAWLASSTAFAQSTGDPVLGERLVEAVATQDTLWVRAANGSLVRFDRDDGARTIVATEGVADMVRLEGRTVALVRGADESAGFMIIDTADGMTLAKWQGSIADGLMSLVRLPDGWAVLTRDKVLIQTTDGWRTLPRPPGPSFGVEVTAAVDGRIYVGRNRGEWGGGLEVIDPVSDTIRQIVRIDGEDICDGPLNPDCDPVTGLAVDSERPNCLLASVGLMHMLAHGRILRVCGDAVEVMFEQAVPSPEDEGLLSLPNEWPFFGIAATADGWVAISVGKLFRSSDGQVVQTEMPALENWHGLSAAFEPDLIILKTDVNWGMSLSGYTPLLAPVTD